MRRNGHLRKLGLCPKSLRLVPWRPRNKMYLFMCNSLIRGYASAGFGDEAILPYVQMSVKGILPDKFTFPFSLSACSKIVAFYEGFSSMERL
ncbi:hypothetical protein ACFX13_012774 [Malus domestica]